MYEVGVIVALWIAFAATHMALSSIRLRPRLAGVLGETGFQGVYSLIALGIFVPLVWFYFTHKHAGPLLWAVPMSDALRWLVYVGNGVALVLAVASFLTPSPVLTRATDTRPRGIQLLTRHGLFMGIGLWGTLHLLPNGYLGDVAFFAGFPVFTLLGASHQDRRKQQTQDGYAAFCAESPFLPFTGKQTLRGLRELSPIALVVGVGLTVVLRVYHGSFFGP
jgi:uncharacterized membrane protein